jgi:hypothetical protein
VGRLGSGGAVDLVGTGWALLGTGCWSWGASGNLGSDLVFGLLVAVRDETIEEGAGSALGVLGVFGLSLFELLVEVTSSLLIELLMLVEVGCRKWG